MSETRCKCGHAEREHFFVFSARGEERQCSFCKCGNYRPAVPAQGAPAEPPCPDCVRAMKRAYSDATTPGFFPPYCDKHAPVAAPQATAEPLVTRLSAVTWQKALDHLDKLLAQVQTAHHDEFDVMDGEYRIEQLRYYCETFEAENATLRQQLADAQRELEQAREEALLEAIGACTTVVARFSAPEDIPRAHAAIACKDEIRALLTRPATKEERCDERS